MFKFDTICVLCVSILFRVYGMMLMQLRTIGRGRFCGVLCVAGAWRDADVIQGHDSAGVLSPLVQEQKLQATKMDDGGLLYHHTLPSPNHKVCKNRVDHAKYKGGT